MSAMRRFLAAASMMAGLSLLAGCSAEPPMIAMAPKSAPMPAEPGGGYMGADDGTPMQPGASASARPSFKQIEDAPRHERPGLATQWGETRDSSITQVSFERADWSSPFASFSLFYNDKRGAAAMLMSSVSRMAASAFPVANGLVTVELRDESARPMRGFVTAGQSFVVGESGHRYSIVLHNRTDHRFEVLLSVDGLDVMDGKSASFAKRGYILDAFGDLEVEGFRQSTDTVAAFRFGSVSNSYAAKKHGDTRNVGVIGVALFHERGTSTPVWSPEELRRRKNANPFPGTFATPPADY
jgi:hypothetical protein